MLMKQNHPEMLNRTREVQAEKPIAATIGNVAGYVVPASIAEKGAMKLLPSVFGGLGKATSSFREPASRSRSPSA
jgi:hypothetical protein